MMKVAANSVFAVIAKYNTANVWMCAIILTTIAIGVLFGCDNDFNIDSRK
jgi:hypothetical protein